MCGTWSRVIGETEGFEEWATAMKLPEELKEKARQETNVTCEISVDGERVTILTKYSVTEEKLTFKLGQTFKHTTLNVDVENVFNVEDGKLVGRHNMMGQVATSKRYFQADKLVVESEGNGATMKNFYVKC